MLMSCRDIPLGFVREMEQQVWQVEHRSWSQMGLSSNLNSTIYHLRYLGKLFDVSQWVCKEPGSQPNSITSAKVIK